MLKLEAASYCFFFTTSDCRSGTIALGCIHAGLMRTGHHFTANIADELGHLRCISSMRSRICNMIAIPEYSRPARAPATDKLQPFQVLVSVKARIAFGARRLQQPFALIKA